MDTDYLPSGKNDEVEVEGTYCPKCGAFLEQNSLYEYLVIFCPNCGYQFHLPKRQKVVFRE